MTNPLPTVSQNGVGSVPADLLNTFVQGGGLLIANLKSFAGVSNMTVCVSGLVAANDGGQGLFYWNSSWTGTPDNVTTVQPNGVILGAWVRLGYVSSLPFTYSLQTVLTGFTVTPSASSGQLILTGAGTLATGTITMPASPIDGQRFGLASLIAVTALTMSGNSAQTLLGGLTTIAANGFATWQWSASASTWYRVG